MFKKHIPTETSVVHENFKRNWKKNKLGVDPILNEKENGFLSV